MISIADYRHRIPHIIPIITNNRQIIASKLDGMINENFVLSFSRNDIGLTGQDFYLSPSFFL